MVAGATVVAEAGLDGSPLLVFVDDEPQADNPAATANPRLIPKITFRAAHRLCLISNLFSPDPTVGVWEYIRSISPNGSPGRKQRSERAHRLGSG